MTAHTRLRPVCSKRIKAALDVAREAGIDVAGYEVSPDGTIRVLTAAAFPAAPRDEWEAWAQSLED